MSTDVGTTGRGATGIWTPGSELNNQGMVIAHQQQETKEAVMVACMDRRLTFKRRHPIRKRYKVAQPDLLTCGGGAYRLCDPRIFGGQVNPERLELWKAQCLLIAHDINKVAVDAHGISSIILATHQSCGMMALDGHKFGPLSAELEKEFHRKVLDGAANWVTENCPGIKEITTCFEYFEQREAEKKVFVQLEELHSVAA